MTNCESDSNQTLGKPLEAANSMAAIVVDSSAIKALTGPKNWARQTPSEFLKIPLIAALEGFWTEAPSVLTLIHEWNGGNQMTSLIQGAFGGLIFTLHVFMIVNSWIFDAAVLKVRLPDSDTFEITKLIVVLQLMILPWNLIWFLLNQITLIKLMMQAMTTTLHWGDQWESRIRQTSLKELNWKD